MPTYPSSRLNKECRTVFLPYVFGQAVSDIPPQDGRYSFHVLRMAQITPQTATGQAVLTSAIYYNLEPTGQTVEASNSSGVKVRRGNKVMLPRSKFGYDIYMDCTEYRTGLVIEPSRPMLMPTVPPNFAGTDSTGKPYSDADLYRSLSYRNALCTGTLAVEGVRYFPIQATYRGGERYYDNEGNVCYRSPGALRWTGDGRPIFVMRRALVHTDVNALARKDMANQQSGSSGDVPAIQCYLDDQYAYKYIDGSPCPIGLPPNTVRQHAFGEQAMTTDVNKAQYAYDLFLCPKQAEGEPLPQNTLVSVAVERTATYKYPFRNMYGEEIDPATSDVVNQTTTRYFEVLPPTNSYFTKVEGQARTYGFFYATGFDPSNGDYQYYFDDAQLVDLITVLSVSQQMKSTTRKLYANALLDKDGLVQLHYTSKVVNTRQTFPCRGVFRLKTHDTVFDVLFSLLTERGYGVPCFHRYPVFKEDGAQVIVYKEGKEIAVTDTQAIYYTIVRRLADPATGRYVLEIQPNAPYLSNAELETPAEKSENS